MLVRLLGLMAFLLCGLITLAQQAAIYVVDAKTREAIPFANVCLQGITNGTLKHYLTDSKGKVPNDLKEPAKLAISYVGYETLLDTIQPGRIETVYMKPAVFNISEVVVTAQFAPERADKSIYRVNVINNRQIEQKAATNLTDLLAGESNMRVSQGGVLGSSMSMMGLSGENIKFLIDGIPVIGRMNGNIDLNQLNLYNVDHVEIIEGPMSVIYGSNAIAGVINIITKENKSAALTSFADSYYESIGVYNFDAGVSKRFKKNLFSVDAARNYFGGYSENDTQRFKLWKPRLQYNADAYYLYSDTRLRVKLTAQYFNEMLVDKGKLLFPYYETAFDNYFSTVRTTGKIDASYTTKKDRIWTIVTAYSGYNRIKNKYFKDLTTLHEVLTPNADDQDTTSFSNLLLRSWYSYSSKNSKLNYQTGIDLNSESGTGKRILDEKQQIGDYAAFISIKYDVLKSLSLQPGARVIYNTKYAAPLVYSLNVKWAPKEEWTVRASYARGFKAPALKELYLFFVDINHNVRGNPDLKAEYSHNYSLDLVFNHESEASFLSAEASVFYNNISNNITLAPVANSLYTYINIGKHLSSGVQTNISWNLYPALSLKTGFSATTQSFAIDNKSIHSAKAYWNKDVTSSVVYKLAKLNMSFSCFYKYSGKAPQVLPEDDQTILVRWVEDYHTLDLTVMRSFLKNHIIVSAGGKNLFDVRTVAAIGPSGGAHSGDSSSENISWGRTFFLKLALNFNTYK